MTTTTFRSFAICSALVSGLTFVCATASAQPGAPVPGVPGYTLTFDEQGNSLLNGGPNPNPVVPVAGGGIQFYLPGQVNPGFVLATDQVDINSANPNGDSDLLTFSNQTLASGQTVGVMLFESLSDDANSTDLADVRALNFPQPILTINEAGPEGSNGFSYAAGLATYNGISDGVVPEPSTLVLGGLGLLGLVALAWRRRFTRSR